MADDNQVAGRDKQIFDLLAITVNGWIEPDATTK